MMEQKYYIQSSTSENKLFFISLTCHPISATYLTYNLCETIFVSFFVALESDKWYEGEKVQWKNVKRGNLLSSKIAYVEKQFSVNE